MKTTFVYFCVVLNLLLWTALGSVSLHNYMVRHKPYDIEKLNMQLDSLKIKWRIAAKKAYKDYQTFQDLHRKWISLYQSACYINDEKLKQLALDEIVHTYIGMAKKKQLYEMVEYPFYNHQGYLDLYDAYVPRET